MGTNYLEFDWFVAKMRQTTVQEALIGGTTCPNYSYLVRVPLNVTSRREVEFVEAFMNFKKLAES